MRKKESEDLMKIKDEVTDEEERKERKERKNKVHEQRWPHHSRRTRTITQDTRTYLTQSGSEQHADHRQTLQA